MTLLTWQTEKISYLFSLRLTVREIAQKLRLSKNTVERYRKKLTEAGAEPLCKCGRAGSHKGICAPRQKERKGRDALFVVKPKAAPSAPSVRPVLSDEEMIAAFIATRGVTRLPRAGFPT